MAPTPLPAMKRLILGGRKPGNMHPLLAALGGASLERAGLLVCSLLLLLAGAEVFTNGVEWLGHRLGVTQSATGSVLAALGTALPETTIPVIAILHGREAANDVGVGAILGAPFMLATIAMFLVGASVLYFRDRRSYDDDLHFSYHSTRRDLSVFLVGYAVAFGVALLPAGLPSVGPVGVRELAAAVLVLLYVVYLYFSLRAGELGEGEGLDDLHLGLLIERFLARLGHDPRDHAGDPHLVFVAVQTLVALALVVGGARLFVTEIEWLAGAVGVPTAVVALIVAPVATELPETFNSVLWLARDKDTLALNNVTGAMAFQGTLPVTLGILFSDWNLHLRWGTEGFLNAVSVLLAVVGALVVFFRARAVGESPGADVLDPRPFLVGGFLYLLFIAVSAYFVLTGTVGHGG